MWLSVGSYLNKPIYSKLDVSIAGCNSSSSGIIKSDLYSSKSNGEALNLTGFNRIYSVSYLWFATIGAIVTILVGVVVSLITGGNKKDYNPKYMLFKCCCTQTKIESVEENIEMDDKKINSTNETTELKLSD